MKIALDYDRTFTLDPDAWLSFVASFTAAGHDVRVVTIRDEFHDRTADLVRLEALMPVIYTRGIAKRWYCWHFTDGWSPDVWIDDKPETILGNSMTTPTALVEWRAGRGEGPSFALEG